MENPSCNIAKETSSPSSLYPNKTVEGSMEKELEAMEKALDGFIEASKGLSVEGQPDVSGFLQAREKAPHLIETESNPRLFLRRENGNAEAAARRLLNYWSKRFTIFGPEHAFLPLKPGGSIGDAEMAFIKTGSAVLLPCDAKGRSVLCLDFTRRSAGFGGPEILAARARGFFYNISLAYSNPLSQTEGIVILMPLSQNNSMSLPNSGRFAALIHHALPIKVHSFHIVCCPGPGVKKLFKECLIPTYSRAFQSWAEGKNLSVQIGKSRKHLFQKLKAQGFTEEGLPSALGGKWTYEAWEENEMWLPRSPTETMKKPPAAKKPPATLQPKESAKSPPAAKKRPATLQPKESAKRLATEPKSQNLLGEGYEHVLNEVSLSSMGIPVSKGIEAEYSEETLRSFKAAMAVNPAAVGKPKTEAEKEVFLKKRDAIYSKRKYYKKKLKTEGLITSKEKLLTENGLLKAENKRLEALIAEAKRLEQEEDRKQLLGPFGSGLLLPQDSHTGVSSTGGTATSVADFLLQQRLSSWNRMNPANAGLGVNPGFGLSSGLGSRLRPAQPARVPGEYNISRELAAGPSDQLLQLLTSNAGPQPSPFTQGINGILANNGLPSSLLGTQPSTLELALQQQHRQQQLLDSHQGSVHSRGGLAAALQNDTLSSRDATAALGQRGTTNNLQSLLAPPLTEQELLLKILRGTRP